MNIRAKKSLGQNFLKSKRALSKMVEAGDVNAGDIVLEIGPGKGALTEKLIALAGKVIAIEKDESLAEFLKEKYKDAISSGRLDLIVGDILDFDIEKLFNGRKYKIVANIPYYITGAIIQKFLTAKNQPTQMVLLVQKEVCDRIVARDEKESILSISVKAYGTPKYIMKVPARDFSPAPKVDSAILSIENISHESFSTLIIKALHKTVLHRSDLCRELGNENPLKTKESPYIGRTYVDEGRFFEIVKAGFAHKRKVLIRNLDGMAPKEKIKEMFEKLGISEKIRAENLKIDDWLSLTKEITNKKSE